MSLTPQEKQKILQHIEFWENAKETLKTLGLVSGGISMLIGIFTLGLSIGIQDNILVAWAFVFIIIGCILLLSTL